MLVLIAAVAANGVIGAGGALPWHLPDDLRRFRALTTGHPLVMGRKTFESIGRALPGRRTIVVTRSPHWSATDVVVAGSVDEALAQAGGDQAGGDQAGGDKAGGDEAGGDEAGGDEAGAGPVYVAGGGEIYAQTIGRADRLELTHVHRRVEGDTVFPAVDPVEWFRVSAEDHDGFTFATYERPIRIGAGGGTGGDRAAS